MGCPICAEYQALYRDVRGEEKTIIRNDGKSLCITMRGVEFKKEQNAANT